MRIRTPQPPQRDRDPADDQLEAPDLHEQFLAEAAVHERLGRHAEAGVLRDVVRRLRGDDDEDDEGDGAEA